MSIPETPYTRLEMYLDEIARNGGGGGGGGGSSSLSGLTDVDISNPTDGQTLVYNATSGKWENGAGALLVVHMDPQTLALDHTIKEIKDAAFTILNAMDGTDSMFLPCMVINTETGYYVMFSMGTDELVFTTDSMDGYPVLQAGD